MSLIKKLEKRDYGGGTFTNPFGPPNYVIPTNGQLAYADGSTPITPQMAMRHQTVFACVRIIADCISSLPLDAYKGDEQAIEPLPTKLDSPSRYASMLEWLWQVMASLLLSGNAYGLIGDEDRLGYLTQVDLISPEFVTVAKDNKGRKIFRLSGADKPLTEDQIWHLPGPQMPGDLAGLPPIKFAARTIGIGLEAEKFGSDFLTNGIHPTATLETDQLVNDAQAGEIKNRVRQSMATGDIVVLGAGMKLNPWQMTAGDAQVIETLESNSISVAQIFGVPPEMLGVASSGSSVTYANREQRAQDFLQNAINPWLARLERALSAWFPRGTYVKFNTGALLRSDLLTRYQSYELGIRNNFVLPSEARALEDLTPIEGLDDKPLPQTQVGHHVNEPSQGRSVSDDRTATSKQGSTQ